VLRPRPKRLGASSATACGPPRLEVVEDGRGRGQRLRGKKDSSMRVAVDLVKEGMADAACRPAIPAP
jgi:hypothetical protein